MSTATDIPGFAREWRRRLSPTMRQTHVAGDKLFVDWAGDTVPIIDPMTGEVHEAHLFIAVLGASSYTYAEARWPRPALGALSSGRRVWWCAGSRARPWIARLTIVVGLLL